LFNFSPKIINIMQQTLEEIKRQHPDEWLILGSPVIRENDQEILAAELLYHSPDKLTLVQMDKPLMKEHKLRAVIFNRVTPRKMGMLVGGRTLRGVEVTLSDAPMKPLKSIYQ
jgi:hypothetical protein